MAPPSAKLSRKQKSSARGSRARKAAANVVVVPAAMMGLSVLATGLSYSSLATNELLYRTFKVLLTISFVLCGAAHFYPPLYWFYESMVPLPFPGFWIYASGVAMVVSGLGLMLEQWRQEAALAIIFVLISVFPSNVVCVFMKKPRDVVCGGSTSLALLRLPFQITLIIWAQWIYFGY